MFFTNILEKFFKENLDFINSIVEMVLFPSFEDDVWD